MTVPSSTAPFEMWWSLVCNAKARQDDAAFAVALAQYRRASILESGYSDTEDLRQQLADAADW